MQGCGISFPHALVIGQDCLYTSTYLHMYTIILHAYNVHSVHIADIKISITSRYELNRVAPRPKYFWKIFWRVIFKNNTGPILKYSRFRPASRRWISIIMCASLCFDSLRLVLSHTSMAVDKIMVRYHLERRLPIMNSAIRSLVESMKNYM